MQNFTLGKKGISMFLLTFILLIGSLPSFGQTCPTTDETETLQNFCYLQTVGDIVTDGDAIFQTANVTTDTQPIPASEILESGTYYAGSSTGTCARIAITVNVTSADYPENTLYPGSTSFSISPCLNTDFTAEDLGGFFRPDAGYSIRVYETQFGTELATGQLERNDSYFVGQVYTGGGDASENCPSLRVAVGYNPANAPAPTASSPQVFCEGATVADLQAQGTSPFTQAIRWYRTADSFQPLAANTELITGETYYASQIINDRDDPFPPCESVARTAVTVTINPPLDLGTPVEGTICNSEVSDTFPSIDAISNYYLGLLPEGTPTNGTFNPTPAELATQYQNDEDGLGSFRTVYTVGVEGCESSVELTATIVADEDANAGSIESFTIDCNNDEPINLAALPNPDGNTGGTFSGESVNDGIFNPSIGPGVYTITYAVDDSADCVIEGTSDETTFTITVQGLQELPDNVLIDMCITEAQALLANLTQAEAFFNNLLIENGITNLDGDFDDSATDTGLEIFAFINSNPTESKTFGPITYIISNECGEESVEITLTINITEAPEINPAPVCASTTAFDLYTLLEGNQVGTFFNEDDEEIVDGLFNVSQTGQYNIRFTAAESIESCIVGSTTFTLTVSEGAVAASPEAAIVCLADVDNLFPSFDEIRKFYTSMAQRAGFPTNGIFNPTPRQISEDYQRRADKIGDYTTTYTFGSGDCQTSVDLTVTVEPSVEANAGSIADVTVDCDDEEVIVLASLPNEGGNTGGTFTGEGVDTDGNFNPSVGPGTYTITYTVDDTADCVIPGTTDETTFTITVQGSFDLGAPIEIEMCISEVLALNLNPDAAINIFTEELENRGFENVDGTFNPDLETVAGQIAAYLGAPTASRTFETTYSVSTECGDDSVLISLTINNTVEPNAGEFNPAPVCASATLFNLNTLLGDNNDAGGIFTDANDVVIEDGLFNVSQAGPYEITYTVTESDANCTEGEPDFTTFTLTVTEGFVAESPAPAIVCESDVDALFPSNDEVRKFYTAIAQQAGFPTNGTFNPTIAQLVDMYQADEDGLGNFPTIYTFGEGNCQTSVELIVTIIPTEDANAGSITDVTVDCDSDEPIVLASLPNNGASTGGTFSGEGVANGIFDPSVGPGTYTITYAVDDTADCVTPGTSAETTFTITVLSSFDLGAPIVMEMCITEVEAMLTNPQLALDLFNDAVAERTDGDLSGEFTPSIQTIAGQIAAYLANPTATQTFETTYSVSTDCGSDSVSITLTINNLAAPNAGDISPAPVCASATSFDLYSLLGEDNDGDGSFSYGGVVIEDGLFDVSEVDTYSITYTVTESDENCTAGDPDSTTFTLNVVEDVNAGTDGSVTLNENDDPVNLFDYLGGNPDEGGTWSTGNGTFDPATDAPGVYTYTVGSGDCQDSATVTVTVTSDPTDPCEVGTATLRTICAADVQAIFPSIDEIRKYYLSLLDAGVARTGTFNPTPAQLATQYQNDADGLGDFPTTYTLTGEECSASVVLTVRIVEEVNAGTNGSVTLNEDDAPVNLFRYLGGNPTEGGIWSLGNGIFNPATDAPGVYTYSVGSDSCLDTATVTVSVTTDPTDPTDPTDCEDVVDAGADNSVEVCNSDVRNLNDNGVRNLFLGLLDTDVARNGTFEPTISELITQYNIVSNYGDFTTTYTLVDGECSDSAVLTVTVVPANDAGDDRNLTFCTTGTTVNLFDYLSPFATTNGTFEGYANGTFNPATATVGVTTITYEVEDDNSTCSTGNFTSTFTITVAEPQDANAGGNVAVTYCVDENENIQLTSLLGEGAITTGSFGAPFANGTFNPSTAGVGVYPITYTVTGDCITGTETATITVTVQGTSEAPIASANQAFCLVDNPTVADLDAQGAEGAELIWYSDAALTTVAPATTALTNDAVFYVVSSTGDSACETSEAVAVTVTLNTEVSPTIQPEGNEFCRQDSPTVQDLIANLNGTAIRVYTSATGGTAIAATEALVDGVTYYATSTNATTGCESSERRAINVEVGFCGIPEGFSPNGDGINDRFVIPDIAQDYPNYTIEVFNRWGNVVFKGNANTPDWDGVSNQSTTLGDKVLPAGVYFYIVNYNDGSTPPVQGKLYLSR